MNLKEIQDGAPDGATHCNNVVLKDEYLYLKNIGDEWYLWSNNAYWELILREHCNPILIWTAKPIYHTQEEAKETPHDFTSKDGTIDNSLIIGEIKDPTNPSHYKQGKVECIDAIESATVGKKGIEAVLVGNIIKYLWRYEEKNGVEDVEKAKWYLDKLLEKLK